MKAVRPVIASNEVPYLQMRSVVSHSTPGREKKGKDGLGIKKNGFINLTANGRLISAVQLLVRKSCRLSAREPIFSIKKDFSSSFP